jgi:CxxC motif-containing protein
VAEKTSKMICITCPVGCTLEVTHDGSTITRLVGNSCKKGIGYAQTELTDPRRMVASTVRVQGGLHPLLPVYTATPIPKPLIFDLLSELRRIELKAPVHLGQVVLRNALGTGIDVIASRDMPEA